MLLNFRIIYFVLRYPFNKSRYSRITLSKVIVVNPSRGYLIYFLALIGLSEITINFQGIKNNT